MGTVWAFGCSHIAGHSLSTEWSQQRMLDWYQKKMKCKNHQEFYDKHRSNAWKLWYEKYGCPDNANLSFAGQTAKKINFKYKCFGRHGTGIDYSYACLLDNMHQFKKNDIILFELPPTYRYLGMLDRVVQLAVLSKSELKYFPAERTINDMYSLMFKDIVAKNIDNLYFINIYHHDAKQINEALPDIFWHNKITLASMSDNLGIVRMPTGHHHQDAHDQFSNYLIKEIIK
tara:strand:- start:119 stop:808 length:690 start_codon:yes stop_codon:yes gene_type:complete